MCCQILVKIPSVKFHESHVLVCGCFMYHVGKVIGAEKCIQILNMFLKLLWFNSVRLMN